MHFYKQCLHFCFYLNTNLDPHFRDRIYLRNEAEDFESRYQDAKEKLAHNSLQDYCTNISNCWQQSDFLGVKNNIVRFAEISRFVSCEAEKIIEETDLLNILLLILNPDYTILIGHAQRSELAHASIQLITNFCYGENSHPFCCFFLDSNLPELLTHLCQISVVKPEPILKCLNNLANESPSAVLKISELLPISKLAEFAMEEVNRGLIRSSIALFYSYIYTNHQCFNMDDILGFIINVYARHGTTFLEKASEILLILSRNDDLIPTLADAIPIIEIITAALNSEIENIRRNAIHIISLIWNQQFVPFPLAPILKSMQFDHAETMHLASAAIQNYLFFDDAVQTILDMGLILIMQEKFKRGVFAMKIDSAKIIANLLWFATIPQFEAINNDSLLEFIVDSLSINDSEVTTVMCNAIEHLIEKCEAESKLDWLPYWENAIEEALDDQNNDFLEHIKIKCNGQEL